MPEILDWLGIMRMPVETAKFERDRKRLAGHVRFGKAADAWVLVRGNTYRAMTLNPSGFWIEPGAEQHRIRIIGTMDVHDGSEGVAITSHTGRCATATLPRHRFHRGDPQLAGMADASEHLVCRLAAAWLRSFRLSDYVDDGS